MASGARIAYYCCGLMQAGDPIDSPLPFSRSIVPIFGDKLRKQRELLGISLEAISNSTKISTRMLRAIEDEHFDQLPGGVFNKGFVRAYARHVRLDEDEAVADYLAALRDSQIHAQAILPNLRSGDTSTKPEEQEVGAAERGTPQRPLRRIDFRPTQVLIPPDHTTETSLTEGPGIPDRQIEDRQIEDRQIADQRIPKHRSEEDQAEADRVQQDRVAGGPTEKNSDDGGRLPAHPLDDLRAHENPGEDRLDEHPPTVDRRLAERRVGDRRRTAHDNRRQLPWATMAVLFVLIVLSLAWWLHHRRTLIGSMPLSEVVTSAAVEPAVAKSSTRGVPNPASHHNTNSADHAAPTTASLATKNPASGKTTANNALPALAKSAAISPPPRFTLLIRAAQTSWISITADGQPVTTETLIAPAHTSIRASHEIVVKAGNAAGITFLLNGKEIRAGGESGEVKTYTFDSTGLRAAAVDPTPAVQ